jgi:predicted nucleotidyltransferase
LAEISEQSAAAFARDIAAFWESHLGARLLGVYLIGSLAHGGFSPRYSDIDMALIAEHGVEPADLERMRDRAAEIAPAHAAKLSLFWADRAFSIGRFPPLDRLDYLDHLVPLVERERVRPARPTIAEVRAYLAGQPFTSWADGARRFAALATLAPDNHKPYLRALLYPARFVYSWRTGRMASNDDAVDFLNHHAPAGLDADLVARALECRQLASDPDHLFPERATLLRQVAACATLLDEAS